SRRRASSFSGRAMCGSWSACPCSSMRKAGSIWRSPASSPPGRSATASCRGLAPSVLRRSADGRSREVPEARLWGAVLTAIPVALALVLAGAHPAHPDLIVTVTLGVFGFVFAVISSLHSYLILAFAGSKKAAEDVGFYYAA